MLWRAKSFPENGFTITRSRNLTTTVHQKDRWISMYMLALIRPFHWQTRPTGLLLPLSGSQKTGHKHIYWINGLAEFHFPNKSIRLLNGIGSGSPSQSLSRKQPIRQPWPSRYND